jgi:hypothetical protein
MSFNLGRNHHFFYLARFFLIGALIYHRWSSGAFAEFLKATISFVMSVRPSARMEHLGSH